MKNKRVLLGIMAGVVGLQIAMTHVEAGERSVSTSSEYEITLKTAGDVISISTQGKSGYHCNTLYPWKVTLSGGTGTQKVVPKSDAAEFSEKRVTFNVSKRDGSSATLKLSVCNDKQCVMKTEKFAL